MEPFNQEPSSAAYSQDAYKRPGAFENAAMVFAILAIVFSLFVYLSVPFAALALLFVFISRQDLQPSKRARIAGWLAGAAMIISVSFTVMMIREVRRNPFLRYQIQQLLEYYSDPGAVSGPADQGTDIEDIFSAPGKDSGSSSPVPGIEDGGNIYSVPGIEDGGNIFTVPYPGSSGYGTGTDGGDLI